MSSFCTANCKSYSHFFSKKLQHFCVSLDVNFNESLTNDIVSFEQLGPGPLLSAYSITGLDEYAKLQIRVGITNIFSYFFTKTYVVGTH